MEALKGHMLNIIHVHVFVSIRFINFYHSAHDD